MLSLTVLSSYDFKSPARHPYLAISATIQPMKILSVNIGTPEEQTYFNNKKVLTSGHKRPVMSAPLHLESFEGDAQADLKNHGGEDKAVCVYSFDHYAHWEEKFVCKLEMGAFGENLTIEGLSESEVCLGDIFRVGDALGQITQPRVPCSKLAGKFGNKELPKLIHENSFSGFYLRVLSEGLVKQGDTFELVSRHPLEVTVEFANQVLYHQRDDVESLKRVLEVEALSPSWRTTLEKRL